MKKEFLASPVPGEYALSKFDFLWNAAWKVANSDEAADRQTGELLCDSCSEHEVHVKGLQGEIKGLMLQVAALKADKNRELTERPYYTYAIELWDHYKQKTSRKRIKFDHARYELIEKFFLQGESLDTIRLAIDGIAYEPNSKMQKNGRLEIYNSWELLFRNRGTFERYCNRAPKESLIEYAKLHPKSRITTAVPNK